MLFVALLVIGAAAVAPSIAQQLRRDREEEMIHRGVQYSRAIRRYVKKFGRYPTRLEELESTNNLRFLRKRYKDPITGQDFKVLHMGDVQTLFGAGIAGATPAGGPVPGVPTLGGAAAFASQNKIQATAGAMNTAVAAATTGATATTAPNAAQDESNGTPGTESEDAQVTSGPLRNGRGNVHDTLETRVFGGGPIVGVASTSKAETIREFNHKNHYNQWQFIYDPASDRGGLLNTPAQPPLQVAGAATGAAGTAGMLNNGNGIPAQSIQPGMQPGMQPLQAAPTPSAPPQTQQQ
jgi:type II secretory pathway pseudopilin PulG